MDVVYVVGPQKRSEELRYSLRALAAHVPHDRVWIVGHMPRWVQGVRHIPRAQFSTKWANSTANMRAACGHPEVSDEFIYMNDDFFTMRPVDQIPVLHRGPVADVAARTPHSRYRAGMLATARALHALGVAEPLSYELHVPMVVDKARMLDALSRPQVRGIPVVHKRTLYGNLAGIGGEQVADVKVHSASQAAPSGDPLFISTNPGAFTDGPVGRLIRAALPDPCRYEDDYEPLPDPGPEDDQEETEQAPEPEDAPPAESPPEAAPPGRPMARASKAAWVDYAVDQGHDREAAEALTKAELQQIGG
ncbi:hypothetical protein [Nocardiopsis sp. TNDT3]|uniref:hypothetical protein n=1 Tax=Nocardiopsis sp. TNDT3 TaxID=2249354 RepID=UPI000E3E2949|nr:hypothetical protein [Nocardiopsis sp. TNDT3]